MKSFINFLPPWVETNIQPAFYDKESGTVLQQTARMYAKVNQLVRHFNCLSKETKETVEDYIARFVALKDFVDTYFENLDVQEEINNKLDDMVEDGTLQEIITTYIQANVSWTFDSVKDMQGATNLIAGSYAQTLGFYSINDGGGALYFIRNAEESETANNKTTIEVNDGLIAELVINGEINLKQIGLSASLEDNSSILQFAVDTFPVCSVLVIPEGGNYICGSTIDMGSKSITIDGTQSPDYNDASSTKLVFSDNAFINTRNVTFRNLCICGDTDTPKGTGIKGCPYVENCTVCYFEYGIDCNYTGPAVITRCNLHHNANYAIYRPVDSRIINNTINNNGAGISLPSGSNDNTITNNKIEWNTSYGIGLTASAHNIVCDNVCDRNGVAGIYCGGGSTYNVITGNMLRRNGAITDTDMSKCNVRLNGANTGLVFANNTTTTGNSEDDETGTVVPKYAITIDASGDNPILLLNNSLTGGTNSNPIYKSSANNVTIIDNQNPVYESLLIKKENLNVSANGTRDFTIPFHDAPAQYGQGTYRKLVITTRNASDAGYGIKEIYVMLYQQYGSYKVAFSDTTIRTNFTLSGTYDSDNKNVIVTVTSTDSTQYQICMNTYSN